MNIKDEVYSDFKSSLNSVNFNGYNPQSPEFLNSLFTGLMWKLLCDTEDIKPKEKSIEPDENKSDDIIEEINGAKKYLSIYFETNDEQFKQMASDELKHANILLKKAYSKLPSGDEKEKLKNYENIINDISSKI